MARVPRYALQDNPRGVFTIDRKFFTDIERIMEDNATSRTKFNQGMDLLINGCILVVKGAAQKRSMGQVAPRKRSVPALAYRIPVQRITGRYFAGWKIRRIRFGHWMIYNDSIEAYLIETGMYQRVRRPILKLSVIEMLRFLQTTKTAEWYLNWALAPRRDERGRFQSFKRRLAQGSNILAQGHGYSQTYGGSRSGKATTVHRNTLAGPRGRLP